MSKEEKKVSYAFNVVPILVFSFFLVLLVSLGFWQLGRADEKRIFLMKEQQSAAKEIVSFTKNSHFSSKELRYRKTKLTGEYDPQHQFLIDNQIINGKVGYFVLTPFKIHSINKTVLVNRGWVALNKDRLILPELNISLLGASISGTINNFPSVGIRLEGAEIPTDKWPSVVQVVDIGLLSKKLGYDLLPFQIELDGELADGYIRDWKKRTSITPEKHIAYAVQWFGLAITLTLLFIRLNRKVS